MALIQLVYVSSATVEFDQSSLLDLLTHSRTRNAQRTVGGMLLFKDGNFMQVLEGEEDEVVPLYQKIGRDPRHSGILQLLRRPIAQREFGEWSMAFRNLHDPEVLRNPGFNEYLNVSLVDQSFTRDHSRVERLLASFRDSMR